MAIKGTTAINIMTNMFKHLCTCSALSFYHTSMAGKLQNFPLSLIISLFNPQPSNTQNLFMRWGQGAHTSTKESLQAELQ